MTDLMTRLTDARPTEAELDALWSPADRDARLRQILHAGRRRRPSRRAAAGLAATTLAAGAFVPSLLGSGDAAAAADLHALARSAVGYDGPRLTEGTWLHQIGTSLQRNHAPYEGGATYAHQYESWTSYDGRTIYLIDAETGHPVEYDVIHDAADEFPASYQDPTPEFSATLPDSADGLLAYLDPKVFGSSSHTEAMYEALIQLAGSHTLPPRTLAAAFDALATLDHVTTDDVDVHGRPAVEVSYDEQLTHSTEGYVFDRETGQELATSEHSRQSDDNSTTTLSEVVDQVPADVLAQFEAHRS